MRRNRRWMLLVLLVVLASCGAINAKEFALPEVRITAQVNPDGSLSVSERRTYRFSGSFAWASMWIPTMERQAIEGVAIAEGERSYTESTSEAPGTFRVTSAAGRTDIKWFYQAEDEERTFTISYLVRNAVRVYADVAELYWQFIGSGWDVDTQHAEVLVALPRGAPPESVRVWGHGPLHGTVSLVDSTTARWQVSKLSAHQFLEVRMTFPPSLVSQAERREEKAALPSILAEEEEWAARANRMRARAKMDGRVALLTLVLLVLASVAFWSRYGRAYPSDFQGGYFQEPPSDYPPAVLGVLWRSSSAPEDIAATLLDLLRRRYLTVEPVSNPKGRRRRNPDFVLSKLDQPHDAELSSYERMLLELLFDEVGGWLPAGEPVTIEGIKRYARRKAIDFNTWYSNWRRAVGRVAAKHSFFDTENTAGRIAAGVVAFILMILGIVSLAMGSFMFTGGALVLGAIVLFLLAALTRRHTPAARTEYLKWRAFRRFLQHFSSIEDAPVLSVAIWEHYLVYAVVLGVAKETISQLQALAPQLVNDPNYASSWLFMRTGVMEGQPVGSLTNSFVSAVQTALSQGSSGAGAGGGFSSGGGGGGGGGGGSAG